MGELIMLLICSDGVVVIVMLYNDVAQCHDKPKSRSRGKFSAEYE